MKPGPTMVALGGNAPDSGDGGNRDGQGSVEVKPSRNSGRSHQRNRRQSVRLGGRPEDRDGISFEINLL